MTGDGQDLDWTAGIRAVLFDMDGTLIDSEHLTARAIDMLLAAQGLQISLKGPWFHGITWKRIARTLRTEAPALEHVPVEATLQAYFHTALLETTPPPIVGSPDAVRAAARRCATAVVSSSDRVSVDHVVDRLGLSEHFDERVTAEDCQRSKPDPQCFQIAAKRLGVDTRHCLVFEDSLAGLTAAREAGMHTIAIGRHHSSNAGADHAIAHFAELPPEFFESMGTP